MVSAVWYALEVCGDWCHFTAHAAIAALLVVSFCRLMVWGSMISARSAVRIASSASWFALLKPIKGIFLGSHRKTILVLGFESKMVLNFLSIEIDTSWFSCGDASSALLTAVPEGSDIVTKFACCEAGLPKKCVSALRPVWRARRGVSESVTV